MSRQKGQHQYYMLQMGEKTAFTRFLCSQELLSAQKEPENSGLATPQERGTTEATTAHLKVKWEISHTYVRL